MQGNIYANRPKEKIEATTLRNLEETTGFMEALNSSVGRLLFDDLILMLDKKFKLIYEEDATEQDKADFRALKFIGNRWNELIQKHSHNTNAYQAIQIEKNKDLIFKEK